MYIKLVIVGIIIEENGVKIIIWNVRITLIVD